MKRLLPFLLLGLAGSAAHAQTIQLTYGPTTWTLYTSAGVVVSRGHATREACEASITQPGTYRPCTPVGSITAVGVCANSTPPPSVRDADGFMLRGDYAPHTCPAAGHVSFTQTQPVRDPYPSCAWADRPVPVVNCDGLQIAPMLEDGDSSTTQVEEPGPWVEELDYPLGSLCPPAANGRCYSQNRVVATMLIRFSPNRELK
jgi:hypothetical protein